MKLKLPSRSKLLALAVPASLLILPALFWWQIAFAGRVLVGLDLFTYFYPLRDYTAEVLKAGRLPLWNPYLFLGIPLLANIQAGVFYPLNLALIWLPAPLAVNWSIVIHLGLAGLGTYVFGRRVLGLGRAGAWAGGAVYGLGGFLSAQAEHVNQLSVSAWLPWLLLLLELSVRLDDDAPRLRLPIAALLSLCLAISFLAGHTQAWYITVFALGLYVLGRAAVRAWNRRSVGWRFALLSGWRHLWRPAAVLGAALGVSLGLAAVQLLPTLELAGLSIRGGGLPYREVVSFSLKPQLLLVAFLPGYGESLFSEYVAYVGLSGVALALIGLVAARGSCAWRTGLGFSLAGAFLAFGAYNPFYYVFYRLVPGFSLFRAPARWLVLYAFGMALLAGAGLDSWLRADRALGWRSVAQGLDRWRRGHRRGAVLVAFSCLAVAAALALALYRGWMMAPGPLTLAGWGAALLAVAALLGLRGVRARHLFPMLSGVGMAAILLVELFLAGRSLALASPTIWDAYASLRTAPAHLLAAGMHVGPDGRPADPGASAVSLGDQTAHWGVGAPTFRFLSMSGIPYDPGDLAEIRSNWGEHLSEKALYDLVVASKQKEVLAPNLPLLYRISSVDGYDGGVLPLGRYTLLQSLFLPPEKILPDGRMREQLDKVPPARLLGLLNVEYVITDKVQDTWIDDTFYDLQFSATLDGDALEEVRVDNPTHFVATEARIVVRPEGGGGIEPGEPMAILEWESGDGQRQEAALRAEPAWAEGEDVVMVVPFDRPQAPTSLWIRGVGRGRRLVVRGMTLVNGRTGTNRSLVVSGQGRFELVHSGDVKVYRNLDNLPRAYIAGRGRVVEDDRVAIEDMREPSYDARAEVLLADGVAADYGSGDAGVAEILAYGSDEIVVSVESPSGGYLVLTDTWYPGWAAYVDDSPVPVQRANVVFRAVEVPAGRHGVRFRYEPTSLKVGAAVTTVSAGLLLALVACSRGAMRWLARVTRRRSG